MGRNKTIGREAFEALLKDAAKLKAKCDRYEAALKWYADEGNYFGDNGELATAWKNKMPLKANEALSSGEGEKPTARDQLINLCHSLAEEVGKDAETAKAYLESEGIDMAKLEENTRFVTWLAELSKLLHEAASGEPVKINQVEARKWFDDGFTPYQCFRETWNME